MDWNNLTTIQLIAMGTMAAQCKHYRCHCTQCPLHEKEDCESWTVENPEEALRLLGADPKSFEPAEIAAKSQKIIDRLRDENVGLTNALAEAISDKDGLEVDLGDLKAVNDQLREDNEDVKRDLKFAEDELDRVRNGALVLENDNTELRNGLNAMIQARYHEQGRAEAYEDALKTVVVAALRGGEA